MRTSDSGVFAVAIVTVLGMMFFLPLISSTIGAFVGFVVGLVFDDTMMLMAKMLGIPEASSWQLGMILGFVGGFFKSNTSTSK